MSARTTSSLVISLVMALSVILSGCVVVAAAPAPQGAPFPPPAPPSEPEKTDVVRVVRQAEKEAPIDRPPPAPSPTPAPQPKTAPKSPPTRIVAPAIGLDAEIVPVGWKLVTQKGKRVSVWEVADFAAGWHQNSASPGEGGNVVISGHHNIKGEVFRYLVDLNPGDVITLYADGQPLDYSVESRFMVRDKGVPEEQRRENARWIGSFLDERLTLVTCWPYTNNTHRVIVIARPVSDVEFADEDTLDRKLDEEGHQDVVGRGSETQSKNVKRDA